MSTFHTTTSLQSRLQQFGIQRILIADNHPNRIRAAEIASKAFPSIAFSFLASAGHAVHDLRTRDSSRTLVVSEMAMELPTSGIRVLHEAFRFKAIPIVVSENSAGQTSSVSIHPAVDPSRRSFVGTKADQTTWHRIFQLFVEEAAANRGLWPLIIRDFARRQSIPPIVAEEAERMVSAELVTAPGAVEVVAQPLK